MKYTLEYPSELPTAPDDFLQPEVIRTVAVQAEAAGFSAIALSEHPAPSVKWRNNGGHNTLDPIAALSFMAAVTSHLRLMTNLYVLPFRNPYLSAKALGSLDLVSGGRLIAGVGAGYLRSEFSAVGVDMDRRAQLLDEALTSLGAIWNDPEKPVTGDDFAAVGPVWLQRPCQRPHPPIWIGGNGNAAIRRVVEHGDGWMPIIAASGMASTMRTVAIENTEQFGAAVQRLHNRLTEAGRDPSAVDVQVVCPPVDLDDAASIGHAREVLAELEGHGATWAVIHVDGSGPQAAVDYIKAFSDTMGLAAKQRHPDSRSQR
ncbi:LLM class F420-dependent oxidoreductase [Mycolicibacterium conceptionense]|uniref:LLM class F420-dependent oxidoreductase n=2 Tax=Mycolicibacterium TaxID=1866885 RepID=A0A1A1X2B1_9MYCO|nr:MULTISPECIES: LLM class F420-dependent oxidoreductase [Mycolicibacterium]MCW1822657.1 LLM class F420-dependent oxidoreductase [Mycolicibacterium senegalense]OBB11584.1 LLM class F420-dependent oxidoreductase [Mycolicibacterium conceptionense]OBF08695.1 LLM class F420-dependent oxidoreductase [Mycolicibacterium conceptionense]OBF12851.1 LLM class F420-dependent oxidoreductase [Mycolicibacterium conceptionense]OBF45366.1 LLM class F420-dependent oxidoreductase [Mycolicibacterium conceptionens